jgi:hypothetical protein
MVVVHASKLKARRTMGVEVKPSQLSPVCSPLTSADTGRATRAAGRRIQLFVYKHDPGTTHVPLPAIWVFFIICQDYGSLDTVRMC